MLAADFDYELPPELIAQHPSPERDQSRLLVLNRADDTLEHRHFNQLTQFLRAGDVLVLNDSKVIPARLRGTKAGAASKIEMLLVEENGTNDWWVMLKPAKRLQPGDQVILRDPRNNPTSIHATLQEKNSEGHCRLTFSGVDNILDALNGLGEIPLPPYIERAAPAHSKEDLERYQTIYARDPGSVAAPTAGLHFTENLLESIRQLGVSVCLVTLHVGLGTFAPVKVEQLDDHIMHLERFSVSEESADTINLAKTEGRRVIAVGTTTVRVLESEARLHHGKIEPGSGATNIFIHPPYKFRIVDALITNFHLPRSTLLMLASAFAAPGSTTGRTALLNAYAEAIRERYRFFSYGDAMLIL